MPKAGTKLYINEVATRDGFQNEARFVDTHAKVALVNRLSRCGFAKMEVTSFTSPKAIPALRDAKAVMLQIDRVPGVIYTALVPNIRGAERALSCGVDEINLVMSVSESHNLANLRMTREQSFAQLSEVCAAVRQTNIAIQVSLSTAMGCPMEGDVPTNEVLHWMRRFADIGVHGITLCDTTGMAFPSQVGELCKRAVEAFPRLQITLHFHNTRGMALANTLAALDAGIVRFDSSLGGLGGCPYAPGATGNVCTEELVHMLELDRYDTGVDLAAVIDAAKTLPELIGHDVPSQILKAGHRLDLHPRPAMVGPSVTAQHALE